MSRLWVDIERIVLDGVAFDPAKAGRLASLTQMALERLLRERGLAASQRAGEPARPRGQPDQPDQTRSAPAAEERWADELAAIIYRAIDRSL